MREVLEGLDLDVRRACRPLLERPDADVDALRRQVAAHLEHIETSAADLVDRPLARRIAAGLRRLLDEAWPSATGAQRRMIQLAADYFVSDEDAEADLGSPLGLDDDASVFDAVVRALGRPDLVIEP